MKTALLLVSVLWIAAFNVEAQELKKPVELGPYCSLKEKLASAPLDDTWSVQDGSDRIVVDKSGRTLYLLKDHNVVRKYKVSLGFTPEGVKMREGDGKTPEGVYEIEFKNPNSVYNLSLRVSYPNIDDIIFARKHGFKAGGDIMIHGFPEDAVERVQAILTHGNGDWTQGCIAVTDEEIEEIYAATPKETTIEICP